jgi:hypothetical protein
MSRMNLSHLGLYSDLQIEEKFRIPAKTLRKWREKGIGPPWRKVSLRSIRYRAEDVEEFLKGRSNNSEPDKSSPPTT